jgi:hypothetical protein
LRAESLRQASLPRPRPRPKSGEVHDPDAVGQRLGFRGPGGQHHGDAGRPRLARLRTRER